MQQTTYLREGSPNVKDSNKKGGFDDRFSEEDFNFNEDDLSYDDVDDGGDDFDFSDEDFIDDGDSYDDDESYEDDESFEDDDSYDDDDENDDDDDEDYDDYDDERERRPFSLLEKILLAFIVIGVLLAIAAGILIWQFSNSGNKGKANEPATRSVPLESIPETTEKASVKASTSEQEATPPAVRTTAEEESSAELESETETETETETKTEKETEKETEKKTTEAATTAARTTEAPTTAARTTEAPTTTAHEHRWSVISRKEPGCTTPGEIVYQCPVDGETKKETIPATGVHKWEETGRTPATCTRDGSINYRCSECNATTAQPIPATGHHKWEETGRTPATCTENGIINYRCSACGEITAKPIEATGHNWTLVSEGPVNHYSCSNCGAEKDEENPNWQTTAHEHSWTEVPGSRVNPTCGASGQVIYACACGETYSEVLPATGQHSWPMDNTTDPIIRCPVCGAETNNPNYIPPAPPSSEAGGDSEGLEVAGGY